MSLPALIRARLGPGLRRSYSYATRSRIAEVGGGSGNGKPVTAAGVGSDGVPIGRDCFRSISTIFISIVVVSYFRGLEERVDRVQATVDRLVKGR